MNIALDDYWHVHAQKMDKETLNQYIIMRSNRKQRSLLENKYSLYFLRFGTWLLGYNKLNVFVLRHSKL